MYILHTTDMVAITAVTVPLLSLMTTAVSAYFETPVASVWIFFSCPARFSLAYFLFFSSYLSCSFCCLSVCLCQQAILVCSSLFLWSILVCFFKLVSSQFSCMVSLHICVYNLSLSAIFMCLHICVCSLSLSSIFLLSLHICAFSLSLSCIVLYLNRIPVCFFLPVLLFLLISQFLPTVHILLTIYFIMPLSLPFRSCVAYPCLATVCVWDTRGSHTLTHSHL